MHQKFAINMQNINNVLISNRLGSVWCTLQLCRRQENPLQDRRNCRITINPSCCALLPINRNSKRRCSYRFEWMPTLSCVFMNKLRRFIEIYCGIIYRYLMCELAIHLFECAFSEVPTVWINILWCVFCAMFLFCFFFYFLRRWNGALYLSSSLSSCAFYTSDFSSMDNCMFGVCAYNGD